MKILSVVILVVVLLPLNKVSSQGKSDTSFHGADTTLKHYDALFIIDQSDDKKVKAVIRNINNALSDQRLKGKLHVELIAFSDGVEIYKKANHYDTLLMNLKKQGVTLAECENTVREKKISKDELWDFISYVPSGVGEIIIRQYQGWAVVHP